MLLISSRQLAYPKEREEEDRTKAEERERETQEKRDDLKLE